MFYMNFELKRMIIKYKTSKNIVCTLLMTGKQDWCILQIRTYLTYIANVKKSCHMKQQSHRFESMRKAKNGRQVPLEMMSVMALDAVTSFRRLKEHYKHM